MRKNILVGLGLALALAGTAAAQQAEPTGRDRGGEKRGPGMRGEGRRGGPDGLLLKGIELTEGQRAQIAQLRKTQREQMDANRDKYRDQFDKMREARERGDTAAARAIRQSGRQTMEQERAQHIAAIRNVLTAEQRVQFDKNVVELKEREAQRAERRADSGNARGKRGKSFRGGR